MEDVYTIKVKSKPDTRNVYPSERRYSASTVSGLAWVHIALAATSFLLACLALINPTDNNYAKRLEQNGTQEIIINNTDNLLNNAFETTTDFSTVQNVTDAPVSLKDRYSYGYILVVAPSLLTLFGLCAGMASILASVRWYVDRNITWLFVISIVTCLIAFVCFVLVCVWFVMTSDDSSEITQFYKEELPFKDYFIVKEADVIQKNDTHLIIAHNKTILSEDSHSHLFTKRVLSINILIAAFLEFLWSILSIKISYKGMRSNYKDDDTDRRGNHIAVITTIKGNDTKKLGRDRKRLPPKPDLIEHYSNKKIKRILMAPGDNGFFLKDKNVNGKDMKQTDTSSEFYKERMINFLNGCAMEGNSHSDLRTPSVQSENYLNVIPEDVNVQERNEVGLPRGLTPVSWGDTPEHTIYNQNTINFDSIFKFGAKNENKSKKDEIIDTSEICN